MLLKSVLESNHTGLSVYRIDDLLGAYTTNIVDDICTDLDTFNPDLVRIKLHSEAETLKDILYQKLPNRLQYLYSIKRYYFPVKTFGSTEHDPISYDILTMKDWDIFRFLLRNVWEKDFLGYRFQAHLKDYISDEMEYISLLEYFRDFLQDQTGKKQIWLLKDRNKYIGVSCFLAKEDTLFIPLAGILPEFRKHNYFNRLSNSGRLLAQDLGCEYISNGVRTDNTISLKFFNKWENYSVVHEDVYCILGG